MLKSTRAITRTGGIGCPCCRTQEPNRTYRTRENRAWRKDQAAT